jgi:hypothetical protein
VLLHNFPSRAALNIYQNKNRGITYDHIYQFLIASYSNLSEQPCGFNKMQNKELCHKIIIAIITTMFWTEAFEKVHIIEPNRAVTMGSQGEVKQHT